MSWTYDEIENNWLAGGVIVVAANDVVSAFDRCEDVLERQWMEESRGDSFGAIPTLNAISPRRKLLIFLTETLPGYTNKWKGRLEAQTGQFS